LSGVLVIVAVVAVIAIAAVVIMMRGRQPSATDVSESPAAVAAPPVEPITAPREEPAEAAPVVESVAVEETPDAVEEAAAAEIEEVEVEAPVEVAEPEPEVAQPSAEEIGERVAAQLEDSERMLGELAAAAEQAETPQDLGMLEIMKEGLQEVRTAVDKKDWSQAKDKGDALYAQLSLMVQSLRREQAS